MAEEIELKLLMRQQDLPMLDELMQALGADQPEIQRLENTYYDTPSLDLHQSRAALRLRHTGRGWVQTLKTAGQRRGALSQRGEWEEAIAEPRLHPELLPPGVLQADWLPQLQAMFTTHFNRKTWLLEVASAAGQIRVEVAADQGEVALPNGKKDPISELELELKSGPAAGLFTLAHRLAERLPLHPGLASKAERGLRLLGQMNPRQLTAPLLTEQTHFAALAELANHQLNVWIACHENWAFNALEAELHQALRALLRLQGLLVAMQRLCPSAPLHQARVDIKKLLQAFSPLVSASYADRALQQLEPTSVQAKTWRQAHLGYAQRRSDYRQLWQQCWVGQASLNLVASLYEGRCHQGDFAAETPQRLLQAARSHLRFPRQPMEAEVWVQRYPALNRLALLLEQVEPASRQDLNLAQQLIAGIETLQGYQQLLTRPDLPEEISQALGRLRQELLFNLGRLAQALWTAAPEPSAPA